MRVPVEPRCQPECLWLAGPRSETADGATLHRQHEWLGREGVKCLPLSTGTMDGVGKRMNDIETVLYVYTSVKRNTFFSILRWM